MKAQSLRAGFGKLSPNLGSLNETIKVELIELGQLPRLEDDELRGVVQARKNYEGHFRGRT
jgi:hypothetical protein